MKTKSIARLLTACWLIAFIHPAAAELITAAENVELKWVVPAERIPDALKSLGLKEKDAKEERVVFFDTSSLGLHQGKQPIALRARQKDGKKVESTAKWTLSDAAAKDVTVTKGKL